MKKDRIFRGVATALITPFSDGQIDKSALGAIISARLDSGIDALCCAGTTAEAATLSERERYFLYEYSREQTRGRLPLILGTGSCDTESAIKYTKRAAEIGADAALVVAPYYNKGTEEGVYKHFMLIAECSDIPIILYNVPSRTGGEISTKNLLRLSECPKIAGIKEASGSLSRLISEGYINEKLPLYSGNDSEIYASLALGADGVISVVSNVFPELTRQITERYFDGDAQGSKRAQYRLRGFIDALFMQTNPAGIKYAMELAGFCQREMRLPLTPPTQDVCAIIKEEFLKLRRGN